MEIEKRNLNLYEIFKGFQNSLCFYSNIKTEGVVFYIYIYMYRNKKLKLRQTENSYLNKKFLFFNFT